MKKIIIILALLFLLIFTSAVYANDVNNTDLECAIENNTITVSKTDSNVTELCLPSHESDVYASSGGSVKISPSESIKAKDIKNYYKSSNLYKATFFNKNGKPLKNTNVKVSINGNTYTQKTNGNGVFSLKITLKPGNYKATAINPVTGFKLTTNIKILHTIQSRDRTKVYNDGKRFYVNFMKGNGRPLANTYIKFKYNGVMDTRKTDKNGFIGFSINQFKKGKYKFTFYNKDGLKRTFTYKIVNSARTKMISNDYTFISSSSKTVQVKLLDQYGYKLKSGTVVTAKIAGKSFKAKLNGDGVANINLKSLKSGYHKINFKFAGSKYYKSSKLAQNILIIPSKNPTFTVKSTTSFGQGAGTSFKLMISSGEIPLKKKTITLNINGKSYKKSTDKKGMISIPINLKVGKYTVRYSIKNDNILNNKASHVKITVKERITPVIDFTSNSSFYQGPQSLKVTVKDSKNNKLSDKLITLTVKSNSFTAKTDGKGNANFKVIVPPGNYSISFKFKGDNDYAPVQKTVKINSRYKIVNGYGYWLKKEQFESVTYSDLENLSSQGVSDIFLNSNSVSAFGKDRIESWIENASALGIKVHFWIQIFKNNNIWTSPLDNGKVNTKFFTQKIGEIKDLLTVKGIAGINFDYIRFSRYSKEITQHTNAVNSFLKQATTAVRNLNSEIIISCDVFSNRDEMKYYGQDYSFITQYSDVVIPMIYKGNAGQPSSWITSTAKWYIKNSKGAIVWAGLQTYKSDSDITILSLNDMTRDAKAALKSNVPGLVLFRWGLTNYIDFNALV